MPFMPDHLLLLPIPYLPVPRYPNLCDNIGGVSGK
ncbi:hypothetical protein PARMER_03615 [Parabacteroides merdae ATCC 43184]|nr:hypothetical protein PARMER_03615 [Parabacteroides merdae ATCC 43184]